MSGKRTVILRSNVSSIILLVTFWARVTTSFLPSHLGLLNSSFRLRRHSTSEGLSVQEFESGRKDPKWKSRSTSWIIIVDDEEDIRRAVGQFLADRGFRVTACADGISALRMIKSRQPSGSEQTMRSRSLPDVIVSDIRMPEMDGMELINEIRSLDELVEIPVVFLTAKGTTKDRIEGYKSGADAYIPKPFDPDELLTILDNLIQRRQDLKDNMIGIDDLKRDLDEIKYLIVEKGGAGIGNGWVATTNVFLAPDERRVLELVCQGLMTKEIAERAFLSTRRVEQLLTSMFRKTKAKNRTELVRWAVSTGTVKL